MHLEGIICLKPSSDFARHFAPTASIDMKHTEDTCPVVCTTISVAEMHTQHARPGPALPCFLGVSALILLLLAGGGSCFGRACEADHQGGGPDWHGHQDFS